MEEDIQKNKRKGGTCHIQLSVMDFVSPQQGYNLGVKDVRYNH